MVEYVAGAVCGLVYGFLVGYLKYAVLWRKVMKTDEEITMGGLYVRMGVSYGINIVTLLIVFLLRNVIPVDFALTLVATAIGLSLCGKLAPMGRIIDQVKVKESR